jgi:hypothetical protein
MGQLTSSTRVHMHLGGVHILGLDILPLPPIPLAALLQLGGHDFIMDSQAHMLPTGSP